jgi:hypothetical protein
VQLFSFSPPLSNTFDCPTSFHGQSAFVIVRLRPLSIGGAFACKSSHVRVTGGE